MNTINKLDGQLFEKLIIGGAINLKANVKEVKLKINEISRIRDSNGLWNYYNDENIVDGFIVFSNVETFYLEPKGIIPNDEICDWKIIELENGIFEVVFYIGSYNSQGEYNEAVINLHAKEMCLEDVEKKERIYKY